MLLVVALFVLALGGGAFGAPDHGRALTHQNKGKPAYVTKCHRDNPRKRMSHVCQVYAHIKILSLRVPGRGTKSLTADERSWISNNRLKVATTATMNHPHGGWQFSVHRQVNPTKHGQNCWVYTATHEDHGWFGETHWKATYMSTQCVSRYRIISAYSDMYFEGQSLFKPSDESTTDTSVPTKLGYSKGLMTISNCLPGGFDIKIFNWNGCAKIWYAHIGVTVHGDDPGHPDWYVYWG